MNTADAHTSPASSSAALLGAGLAMDWHNTTPPSADSDWLPCPAAEDQLFTRLEQAYKSFGGLATVEQVAAVAERRLLGDIRTVRKMVDSRRIFVLRNQDVVWIPVFQIERETMGPKEHVRRVVAELRPAFDDWGIAQWFTESNAWLRHRTPLAMINRDLGEVMNAARADCFVAGA